MNWTRRRLTPIERDNDRLRVELIQLRRELENKQGAVGRLEVLLRERLTKIDQLNATIDRLREQNREKGQMEGTWDP